MRSRHPGHSLRRHCLLYGEFAFAPVPASTRLWLALLDAGKRVGYDVGGTTAYFKDLQLKKEDEAVRCPASKAKLVPHMKHAAAARWLQVRRASSDSAVALGLAQAARRDFAAIQLGQTIGRLAAESECTKKQEVCEATCAAHSTSARRARDRLTFAARP